MLEDLKGNISADMRDACSLFDFVTEKNRTEGEINSVLCSLSHMKYPYSKSLKGHELRKSYKIWLRRKLRQMLRDYYSRKLREPNGLNNSKA